MTKLKVCGLHRNDDVSFTSEETVTHVGFIFVPNSRRFILPTDAKRIVTRLGRGTHAVGVFVDTPIGRILETVQTAELGGVQLHGDESPEMCRRLRRTGVTVWKSLAVPQGAAELETLMERISAYSNEVDAILLDTAPPKLAKSGVTGGHGSAFEWGILPALSETMRESSLHVPVWVAGGITPESVSKLLSVWRPFGVDVSSGVEIQGRKSQERINQLISVVSQYV